jgi:hypothetical protein
VELDELYQKYHISGFGLEGQPETITYQVGHSSFTGKRFPLCIIPKIEVVSYVTGETRQSLSAYCCENKNTDGDCMDFKEKE